jgi:hypothetical protein
VEIVAPLPLSTPEGTAAGGGVFYVYKYLFLLKPVPVFVSKPKTGLGASYTPPPPPNGLHYGYRCLENTLYLDIPINMYFCARDMYCVQYLSEIPVCFQIILYPPPSYSFMLILYCTPTSRFLRKVVLMVNLHNKIWLCALKSRITPVLGS